MTQLQYKTLQYLKRDVMRLGNTILPLRVTMREAYKVGTEIWNMTNTPFICNLISLVFTADNIQEIEFTNMKPIYHCKNAFIRSHRCTYILCCLCGEPTSRRNRNSICSPIKKNICSHKKEYLLSQADIHFVRGLCKQAKDNEMLPTVCADCKKDITINSCTLKSIRGVAV